MEPRKKASKQPRFTGRFARRAVLVSFLGASLCMPGSVMASEPRSPAVKRASKPGRHAVKDERKIVVVSKGEDVYSSRSKEFISLTEYSLKVRGIDKAGVEFEFQENRFADTKKMRKLGIKVTSGDYRRSTKILTIFRVNFDGTKTHGIRIAEKFGLQDFRAEPAEGNKVRVSYTVNR